MSKTVSLSVRASPNGKNGIIQWASLDIQLGSAIVDVMTQFGFKQVEDAPNQHGWLEDEYYMRVISSSYYFLQIGAAHDVIIAILFDAAKLIGYELKHNVAQESFVFQKIDGFVFDKDAK